MQIVIDIPEGMVKALEQGCFGAKYNIYDLCGCVMNGTPLPKGHGALKDADMLVKAFKEEKDFYINSWGGFECMPKSDKARCDEIDYCGAEVINAPTIIEADKEGAEE